MASHDLSWSCHIATVVTKARSVSCWVLSVFKSRSCEVMMTLYKSLVRSHLEYCSPLWHPSRIGDIEKIEDVQREFTRRINGCHSLNYWERLSKLKLYSLQRRRERFILITMWKILYNQVPCMGIRFRPESRLGIQAVIPSLTTQGRASNRRLFDESFSFIGPTLWNSLPSEVSTLQSFSGFKSKLDKVLQGVPDQPPVTGYSRAHGNTLPEVLSLGRMNQGRSRLLR